MHTVVRMTGNALLDLFDKALNLGKFGIKILNGSWVGCVLKVNDLFHSLLNI